MIFRDYPAVVVHGLPDARVALAAGRPLTLLSGEGAALYAGSGWWRALIETARREHPLTQFSDILDCADAAGLALGALRIGQQRIVLLRATPGWVAVAAIAAELGAEVLDSRPRALDMADRSAARHLQEWLAGPPPG